MGAPPPVSIGLPVYNGERYLQTTLTDWQAQTFADFELIVCDNASTDATADILAQAAREDSRIRVVRNARNLGALPNANKAFALARAPLYTLSAYDDRHAPTFLAALVEALRTTPEAGMAYGRCTLIDEADRPLVFDAEDEVYRDAHGAVFDYDARLNRVLPARAIDRYRAVLRSNDVNGPVHGLFRRALLEQVGPHRLYGSDRLLVAVAALLAPFSYADVPLFGYRIHASSTLHLTRSEWLAREGGAAAIGSPMDGARTLKSYLSAVLAAPVSFSTRVLAATSTLRYAVRPAVLRRIFMPGPDNYFGWTGASAQLTSAPSAPVRESEYTLREWEWLQSGVPERRTI